MRHDANLSEVTLGPILGMRISMLSGLEPRATRIVAETSVEVGRILLSLPDLAKFGQSWPGVGKILVELGQVAATSGPIFAQIAAGSGK